MMRCRRRNDEHNFVRGIGHAAVPTVIARRGDLNKELTETYAQTPTHRHSNHHHHHAQPPHFINSMCVTYPVTVHRRIKCRARVKCSASLHNTIHACRVYVVEI